MEDTYRNQIRTTSNNKKTATKTLRFFAKKTVSPSSRRQTLKNFSPKSGFNTLRISDQSKNVYQNSIISQSNQIFNDSSKLVFSPKSPESSLNSIMKSSSIKIFPKRDTMKLPNSKSNLNLNLKQRTPFPDKSYIKSIGFKTRTGSVLGKSKAKNQDNFFIINNFASCQNQLLVGVMDGHGVNGQEVSLFVKRTMPQLIENSFPFELFSLDSQDVLFKLKKALQAGIANTQKNLISKGTVDINYSGTTAVTVLIKDRVCICANVGDSRAIIARHSNTWYAIPLSVDHKPSLPAEKARILNCGGRVESFQDPFGNLIGPLRVWLQKENAPGLAMSRSIGDLVASQIGVSSEAEVQVHRLSDNDKFLVMASDGLWEFVSNEECVEIVSKYYVTNNSSQAAEELVNEAVKRWEKEENVIDDITVVVIFFYY